ncbi:PREDICTED: uncharacterized protein LOC104813262 [Tarenaya hassleriana]|uniref:uncharacterized protein LOC104813262 n=1 Tax=Tarenaya hassleriana TaxID=28532 RepID=UPI00053C0DDA|nr:PREDICTED: uncharacterized protein LOC104813262 [Tarenaya hassleriana]
MEETRKREGGGGEDATPKKVRTEAEDDVMAGDGEQFTAEELMKLLEEDDGGIDPSPPEMEDSAAWSGGFRVRFIEDPYATSVVFQSATSPGHITINGNEESCGSSFSDSDASVMASVDARGLIGSTCYFSDPGGAWGSSEAEVRRCTSSTDAFDDGDLLARFLGEDDDCV